MESDEDHDFENMLVNLEQDRKSEEELIASLQEELARLNDEAEKAGKYVTQLRLDVEHEVRNYERDLRLQMEIQKQLSKGATIVNNLKDHLICINKTFLDCDRMKEFLVSQVEIEERKVSSILTKLGECDLEAEYKKLEKKLAEMTQFYESEKEYYDIKVEELEDAIKHCEDEHKRDKRRLANEYEPRIKMIREKSKYFENCLREEYERGIILREQLAEEKEQIAIHEKKIAEVEKEMEEFKKTYAQRKAAAELKLAQAQEKLEAETKKLEEDQKLEEEMRSRVKMKAENVKRLRASNAELRKQLAESQQKRRKDEEALAALEKDNSSLEEAIKNSESELSVAQEENSKMEQRNQRMKEENKDLNEELELQKKTFEETYAKRKQQLDELKAKSSALEVSLGPVYKTKAKLEEVLKEKEALIAENIVLDKQNEELEHRIADHAQDLNKSMCKIRGLSEKLADCYHNWTAEAAASQSAIEEKNMQLDDMKTEIAEAIALVEQLRALEEKEKSLLAQEKSDFEELKNETVEECSGILKAAEEEDGILKAEKSRLSAEFKEKYLRMEKKLTDKNKEVATWQKQEKFTLRELKRVQSNIVHVQDLLQKNMVEDNKQILEEAAQQVKATQKFASYDQFLTSPTFLNPILSGESMKAVSSAQSTLPPPSSSAAKTRRSVESEKPSSSKKNTRRELFKPVSNPKDTLKETFLVPESQKETPKETRKPSSPQKRTRKEIEKSQPSQIGACSKKGKTSSSQESPRKKFRKFSSYKRGTQEENSDFRSSYNSWSLTQSAVSVCSPQDSQDSVVSSTTLAAHGSR